MLKLIPLPYYKLAALAIVFAAASIALWRLHSNIWNSGYEAGKVAQSAVAKAECDKVQKVSTEVSDAYQKKIASLNNELNALRMRPPKCVAVTTIPASGHNAAASGAEHVKKDGVPADALYGFAAEAEQYRLQLIACQEFITKSE